MRTPFVQLATYATKNFVILALSNCPRLFGLYRVAVQAYKEFLTWDNFCPLLPKCNSFLKLGSVTLPVLYKEKFSIVKKSFRVQSNHTSPTLKKISFGNKRKNCSNLVKNPLIILQPVLPILEPHTLYSVSVLPIRRVLCF